LLLIRARDASLSPFLSLEIAASTEESLGPYRFFFRLSFRGFVVNLRRARNSGFISSPTKLLSSGRIEALTTALQKIRLQLKRRWRACVVTIVFLVTAGFGISEALSQRRENRYVEEMAQSITRQANASGEQSKIIALRDYLRHNVTRNGYPVAGRPFLRDTAAYALQTGKGRCGEVTRAFINMADAVGIHAQRLYLEGRVEHVVALVKMSDGRQIIVDSTEQPYFQDLETLDQLSQHPQFNYYEPINIHRWFRITLPANTVDLGLVAYLIENPHALKAVFCFSLAGVSVVLLFLSFARRYFRSRRAVNDLSGSNMIRRPAPALATADQ